MKTNYRALKLVEMGLSAKVVSKLNESQLDTLYSKLLTEQVKEVPQKKAFEIGPQGGKVGDITITQDPVTKKVIATTESELSEDLEDPMDFEKGQRTQSPKQVGPSTDDGFGNYDDGTGEFSEGRKKSKVNKSNPWAICTSQLGKEFGTTERSEWSKKQSNKYERCVKDVKKSLKEGKEPLSLFIENEIMNIVEKHLAPRITKKELMNYLLENSAEPAIKEPIVKPDTPTKPRPSSPGKNPFPKEKSIPKAKLPSPEVAKEKVIDLIIDLITKNEK